MSAFYIAHDILLDLDCTGRVDFAQRLRSFGKAPGAGTPLNLDLVPGSQADDSEPDSPAQSPAQDVREVQAMISEWELSGAFATAGMLENMSVAAGGACFWIKLHYGTQTCQIVPLSPVDPRSCRSCLSHTFRPRRAAPRHTQGR